MSEPISKVTVLGGGVAGLAVAARLQADGMEVGVYDRRSKDARGGHGLILTTRPEDPFKSLGKGPAADSKGAELCQYELQDLYGNLLHQENLDGVRGYRREEFLFLLESRLQEGTLHYEAQLEGFERWKEDTLHAALFADGSRSVADLFIAAEGSGPVARPLVGHQISVVAVRARELGCSAYSPDVATYLNGRFLRYEDPNGKLAVSMIPTGEGWVTWFVQFSADTRAEMPVRTPHQRRVLAQGLVGHWPEPLGELLNATDFLDSHVWNVAEYPITTSLFKGNLVLIGDSAHPFLPLTRRGASTALEDAAALGDELWQFQIGRKVLHSSLTNYSKQRLNVAQQRLEEGRELIDRFLTPHEGQAGPLVW